MLALGGELAVDEVEPVVVGVADELDGDGLAGGAVPVEVRGDEHLAGEDRPEEVGIDQRVRRVVGERRS